VHAEVEERLARIRENRIHGASWMARQAVEALVCAARVGEDPLEVARTLVRTRPSIGAISGALGRVLASARSPEQVPVEAQALIAGRDRASRAIAVLLSGDLADRTVMTHSASATVREAVLHTRPARVVCTVSEPGGEGRMLYDELRSEGIVADVVDDTDAAHAVGTVDVLLLGADTVFRDGSFVNKAGSRGLAKAAADAGVPVLVASETIKLAPVDGRDAEEEAFELVAGEHVTRFVTEEGAFEPDDVGSLCDRTPFLVEGHRLLAD
jgi:translation initiation factor 2B subunit (eIF-2B alpha/beta/delta family)